MKLIMNEDSSPPGVSSPPPGQWSPAPDVPRVMFVHFHLLPAGVALNTEHAKHAESDSEAKKIYLQINET